VQIELKSTPLVLNSTAVVPTLLLAHVTINLKPKIRMDSMEGRDFMVCPMVMLTAGVHAGSQGPLLYTNEEIEKCPEVWDHKPIVVYHPMINGRGVSACDPDILTNRKIGVIMRSHTTIEKVQMTTNSGGSEEILVAKLHAEAWLERDRIELVDNRINESLDKGEMVELSTGLFLDQTLEEGSWHGKDYIGTVQNFRPDHLAILPDQTGACSIADGAGLLRNQTSHENTRSLIRSALEDRLGPNDFAFIEAVFDTFFIYELDNKLFRQFYTQTDTEVTLVGDPDEVVRVTEFRTLTGEFVGNKKEHFSMDKKKFIDGLIANGSWTEEDRKFLEGMSEDQLTKVGKPVVNEEDKAKAKATVEAAKKTKLEAEAGTKDAVTNAETERQLTVLKGGKAAPKEVSVEDYIAQAPLPMRDMLANGMRAHEDQKVGLVKVILANERNVFTEEQLGKMDLVQLKQIAVLAQPAQNAQQSEDGTLNMVGLADMFSTPEGEEAEAPMEIPIMNFDTAAK